MLAKTILYPLKRTRSFQLCEPHSMTLAGRLCFTFKLTHIQGWQCFMYNLMISLFHSDRERKDNYKEDKRDIKSMIEVDDTPTCLLEWTKWLKSSFPCDVISRVTSMCAWLLKEKNQQYVSVSSHQQQMKLGFLPLACKLIPLHSQLIFNLTFVTFIMFLFSFLISNTILFWSKNSCLLY